MASMYGRDRTLSLAIRLVSRAQVGPWRGFDLQIIFLMNNMVENCSFGEIQADFGEPEATKSGVY